MLCGVRIVKLAGEVVSCRGKRLVVARCDAGQLPPLYSIVCDSQSKDVGRIVDLYGSVSKPYVTILCNEEGTPALVGTELYVVPESKPEVNSHQKKMQKRKGKMNGKRN